MDGYTGKAGVMELPTNAGAIQEPQAEEGRLGRDAGLVVLLETDGCADSDLRPELSAIQQTLWQLIDAPDGYVAMKEIQSILSSCYHSRTVAGCITQQAWAWVRLVVDRICALGRFVKSLRHGELPSKDEVKLIFDFLNAAVELIVPVVTSADTSRSFLLTEDQLKDLISALDHIKVMFSHMRAPPAVFKSTRVLLTHLRTTIPSSEDWCAKHVSIMNRRRKFADMLQTLEDWAVGRRCRGSAMDLIMDQFEKNIQSSMNLWDLSHDTLVHNCVTAMGEILPTLDGPILQAAERQLRWDAWKNAFNVYEEAVQSSSTDDIEAESKMLTMKAKIDVLGCF